MYAEVSLEFLKTLSASEKADFGDDRDASINGNPDFTDAASHDIILNALVAEGVLLRAAVTASIAGNEAQKLALGTAERKWDRLARKWAKYVTEKAQAKATLDEMIAVITNAGFDFNKVDKTPGAIAAQVTGVKTIPIIGFAGKSKIKSDSLGKDHTYVSIFSKNSAQLDAIVIDGEQIILPANADQFIINITTNSRETEVRLSSGEKWHCFRYAVNKTGRGPNSSKDSVTPQ